MKDINAIETMKAIFVECNKHRHEALLCEVKERMRRFKDGARECVEGEDGGLSMGRVERVQEEGG